MLQCGGSIVLFLTCRINVNRRLEDRIRQLCEALIATDDDAEEFPFLAVELKSSLKEHIERIRSQVVAYPPGKDRRVA